MLVRNKNIYILIFVFSLFTKYMTTTTTTTRSYDAIIYDNDFLNLRKKLISKFSFFIIYLAFYDNVMTQSNSIYLVSNIGIRIYFVKLIHHMLHLWNMIPSSHLIYESSQFSNAQVFHYMTLLRNHFWKLDHTTNVMWWQIFQNEKSSCVWHFRRKYWVRQ